MLGLTLISKAIAGVAKRRWLMEESEVWFNITVVMRILHNPAGRAVAQPLSRRVPAIRHEGLLWPADDFSQRI